jgi:transcriptional regulator with XRE-family HTH domain
VQSALLRNELTRLRKDKGLTQEQVAADLEWSPSKLTRIEGGRNPVTKVDLDALLNSYGVTSESQRERLQALNRGARERGWWSKYRSDISDAYLRYVGYEAGAALIRQFQGSAVPGLLQTREYAEVVTDAFTVPTMVRPVVDLRLQRQAELGQRSDPPRQHFVLDEGLVHRRVGVQRDPTIMPNQLRHIADMAEGSDRITVRIIPFESGEHGGLAGPFTLLEFDGNLSDMLYLDAGRTAIATIEGDDPRIAEYADVFESLQETALSADESVTLLRRVAEEMS